MASKYNSRPGPATSGGVAAGSHPRKALGPAGPGDPTGLVSPAWSEAQMRALPAGSLLSLPGWPSPQPLTCWGGGAPSQAQGGGPLLASLTAVPAALTLGDKTGAARQAAGPFPPHVWAGGSWSQVHVGPAHPLRPLAPLGRTLNTGHAGTRRHPAGSNEGRARFTSS